MCTVCGCGQPDQPRRKPYLAMGRPAAAARPLPTPLPAADRLHYGQSPAGVSVPGLPECRVLSIQEDVLAYNDGLAAANRRHFAALGVRALNLLSSPGSGKTSLLVATLQQLAPAPLAVIEGDQQTTLDAERVRATGVPAIQVNTGAGCHLDARMIGEAVSRLELVPGTRLFIENVGNLVCPAHFDLGEAARVVLFSVTEGEDKPLKYPDMFRTADVLVISKIDLLPYLDFDLELAIRHAQRVRPGLRALPLSAKSGAGMADWLAWLADTTAAPTHTQLG